MVGRPFTSSGCANCRKRKIKSTQTGEAKRPVRQLVGQIKPLALSSTFSVSAEVRAQLFSNFMDTFFASSSSINGKDDSLYFLMARFPTLAGESEPLDRSVIALATTFLAKTKDDRWLGREGLEIYNTALNSMQYALQRGSSPSPNMLYATIIFHTYETMNGRDASSRNCFTHIQGAAAIMTQTNFKTQDVDSLTKAMLTRQKWATAHFMINTEYGSNADRGCLLIQRESTPIDEMFGLVAEWSILRDYLNKIAALETTYRETAYKTLLRRCYQLEKKLHEDWLNGPALQLDGNPSLSCREGGWSDSSLMSNSDRFPYVFKNLNAAKIYILYWVTSLVTSRVIYEAEALLHGHCDPTKMISYATKILRSVPYLMQRERQMSSVHVVIFGVSQASRCYIHCGKKEEFERCQEIYRLIALRGFDMASHMAKEHLAYWYLAQGQPVAIKASSLRSEMDSTSELPFVS
ncbi:hypothetical protein BDW60DRAFT_216231 [Aspergillus nidulans var. acristatus]